MSYEEWRNARWNEIAGQDGKAKVVASGTVTGHEPQVVPGTPGIGRWLVLPLLEPGSKLSVDFNQATLSHHHVVSAVFTMASGGGPGLQAGEESGLRQDRPGGAGAVQAHGAQASSPVSWWSWCSR
jgi:hypothetical protein